MVAAMTREPRRDLLPIKDIESSVIAPQDIRAQFSFESVDLQKTREAQSEAAAKVPEYYRVDRDTVQSRMRLLEERIERVYEQRTAVAEAVRAALLASTPEETPSAIAARVVAEHAAKLKADAEWDQMPEASLLALWLMPDAESLPERRFSAPVEEAVDENQSAPAPTPPRVEELIDKGPISFSYGSQLADVAVEALEYVLSRGIRSTALPPGGGAKTIVLVPERPTAETLPKNETTLAEVPDVAAARDLLANRLRETAKRAAKDTAEPTEWAKLFEAALAMAEPELTDTIRFDEFATGRARTAAREAVVPIMKEIAAGEIIQEAGRRWTEQSRADAKQYTELLLENERPAQRVLSTAAAHLILVLMAVYALVRSIPLLRPARSTEGNWTYLLLALLLMTATLVAGRVVLYFQPTGFVLPVAAAAILCAILTNGRIAAMTAALTALLVSAQYGYDWRLMVVFGAMSLAGALSVQKVRRRGDMAAAALKATLAGLIAILAISLAQDALSSNAVLQRALLVLLNGGICMMLVPGLLSPLERLFRVTTDIQLLEYSDLNNALLSKLAIEVPATYAHSLMLGQLAEAAADAIGANGLKARVCAYYHDIGKTKRPEYFCENQTGVNIHDELSPRLSARAIAAHVTQGAEMAREARLPKPIIDGILEHHGTCLIGYFYQQAKEQHKHGDVREADFRYPGPRPQSPETAILMICDAVESGVRSIKNPNEERVREFVDKIIAARSADRQFDECHLTLKQLDTIAEVVTRRMVSALHGRISYPQARDEAASDNIIPMSGGVS
jgi:putative nucleotidyltransferase with HDIG domain